MNYAFEILQSSLHTGDGAANCTIKALKLPHNIVNTIFAYENHLNETPTAACHTNANVTAIRISNIYICNIYIYGYVTYLPQQTSIKHATCKTYTLSPQQPLHHNHRTDQTPPIQIDITMKTPFMHIQQRGARAS